MKILGFDINVKRTPIAAANPLLPGASGVQKNLQPTLPSRPLRSSTPRAELGDSGTRLLHGIITEEYNSQLQGIEGIKIFDEMRKSDGTVRAAILACTLPIRRAEWFVNPATDDQESKDIANFVEHALFDWLEDMSWDDVIRQALLSVSFGVMLFEKVYGTKDHEGKTYVTLKKLAPRLPKSILMWELTDGTFGIQQIRQDGILAQIPGSKLLIFVNEREGDNWWGTSMLRAAYKHWYYKNNFYKIDAVAFERQGLGIPVISMPQGYTESDEKKAATAMENLRANEAGYLVKPPGYTFEFANMGAHTTRDPNNSINHHNKEILQSVLAQFLELGQTKSNSGSRALSQDHSDLFLKALEAIANNLIAEINKNLIPELVDMNFDNVTVYPVLDFGGIIKADVTALGTAYSQLVTAGAITPTDDDQQYLRASMGLPPRSQDDIDAAAEQDPSSEEQLDHANIEEDGEAAPEGPVEDAAGKAAKPAPTAAQKKKTDKATAKKKKPAKAHDHTGVALKRTFTDGKGFMSWRPLTFAEGKVNWAKIQQTIDEMEAGFTADATALLQSAKDAFMAKLHAAADAGDTKAIADLEIKFVSDYKDLLKEAMKKAYEYGKNNVSTEMGVSVPPNSADSLAEIDLMADTIANKTASDLESKAKIETTNHLKQDTSILQAVGAVDATLDDAIDKAVQHTAGIIISQNLNGGRNDVFQRNRSMIYALQRSEVLDERTCEFCLSMDGLTVLPTDDWAATDVFHENCRGIWVEILTDEQDVEDIEITGVPDQIGDYYGGTPNDLIQPPKAITRPGTPAAEYVKQREADKATKKK
jgi:hypothetical protein